jgi:hypothetical protein
VREGPDIAESETRDTCVKCGKAIPAQSVDDAFCVKCRYSKIGKAPVSRISEFDVAIEKTPAPDPHPAFMADEESGDAAPGGMERLSIEQILSLIVIGSYDSKERDMRLLWISMQMRVPGAPKTISELAVWLDRPRTTVREWASRISQCFRDLLRNVPPPGPPCDE